MDVTNNFSFEERKELAVQNLVYDSFTLPDYRWKEAMSLLRWLRENEGNEDWLNYPKLLAMYFASVGVDYSMGVGYEV